MFLAQCQQPPWCVETKTSRNSTNPHGTESNFIRLTCFGLWPLRVFACFSELVDEKVNCLLRLCYFVDKKKPHWQFSLLLQLVKSFDRTQKGHRGEKKTTQSDKTNWALCPEYWWDWIVLQIIAAWSKKILPREPVEGWNVAKCKCVPVTPDVFMFMTHCWNRNKDSLRVCRYVVCCSEVPIHLNPWFVSHVYKCTAAMRTTKKKCKWKGYR